MYYCNEKWESLLSFEMNCIQVRHCWVVVPVDHICMLVTDCADVHPVDESVCFDFDDWCWCSLITGWLGHSSFIEVCQLSKICRLCWYISNPLSGKVSTGQENVGPASKTTDPWKPSCQNTGQG